MKYIRSFFSRELQKFEAFPTHVLHQRFKLTNFALNLVWIAAALSIVIGVYRMAATKGTIGASAIFMALLAVLASIPVYFERKRIQRILKQRQ